MSAERPYCACATPPGTSGIAVIRMAGPGSADVMDRVFSIRRSACGSTSVTSMQGYTAAYGVIFDPVDDHIIDEIICTRFTAPHSYTGEDSIEISCHGGTAVRQEILRVLMQNGARPAEPGEFTKQAFLSGKIDLSQAEAVMDVISAESAMALTAAERQLSGALKSRVRDISSLLYRSFAALEMLVEFPEHEDTPENLHAIMEEMDDSLLQLRTLRSTYGQGRILRDGMSVVLGGIPNSGKSSLFNCLAGYDRAIVTAQPGTTRDTLEVYTSIRGVPIRLEDTAGIRNTEDEVESIGVVRAQKALANADLLLWLCSPDDRTELDQNELHAAMTEMQRRRSVGILISKSDLITEDEVEQLKRNIQARITAWGMDEKVVFFLVVSSETGRGIDVLGDKIQEIFDEMGTGQPADIVLTNERHFRKIEDAIEKIKESIAVFGDGSYADISCSLIRGAMDALGEITGDTVSDELVQTIFSRFCIGK